MHSFWFNGHVNPDGFLTSRTTYGRCEGDWKPANLICGPWEQLAYLYKEWFDWKRNEIKVHFKKISRAYDVRMIQADKISNSFHWKLMHDWLFKFLIENVSFSLTLIIFVLINIVSRPSNYKFPLSCMMGLSWPGYSKTSNITIFQSRELYHLLEIKGKQLCLEMTHISLLLLRRGRPAGAPTDVNHTHLSHLKDMYSGRDQVGYVATNILV